MTGNQTPDDAGRSCPLRYRYGAAAIAAVAEQSTETLYVIGGLYGNLPALDTIEAMAQKEDGDVTLCFNGDFNWFNVDDASFRAINERVMRHHALSGNVEAELWFAGDEAGCGCAYPVHVDAAIVERSNRIHARLKASARRHADVTAWLATLPMFARYRVGDCLVGVVHGDADSLAGWRFGRDELVNPANANWLNSVFDQAQVDVFASSHTCEPALVRLTGRQNPAVVINNGAAGMPNFEGERAGLITRIGRRPYAGAVGYATTISGTHVEGIPVHYNHAHWASQFLSNWPEQSDAHRSYYRRILGMLR